MRAEEKKKLSIASLVTATIIAATGVYFWQTDASAQGEERPTRNTRNAPPEAIQIPEIREAIQMQQAFREIAETVEPAVVTITTTVAQPRMIRRPMPGNPYGPPGGSPFGGPQSPYGGPRGMDPFEEFMRRFPGFGFEENSASPEQWQAQENFRPVQQGPGGLGSGFIYDRSGLIITNAHVVRGASTVSVKLADGREFSNARVLGSDSRSDIAVIKIEGENLPVVTLGDSNNVQVGDWAIAVGNPFGFSNTLTVGVISAKAREVPAEIPTLGDYLQTDASINPGNSGGPLLDIYGRVVGVNNSIWSPTGGNIGIGFAIPVNTAKRIAAQLVDEGRVRRAYLGVGIGEIQDAAAYGLAEGVRGVLVESVEPNTPAGRVGLQPGDVITRFNGEEVTRPAELTRKVTQAPIGQEATLTVIRDGRTLTLQPRLDELKEETQNFRPVRRTPRGIPEGESVGEGRESIGVQIAPLTADLAQRLGIEGRTQGVVIVGIQPNSPAERAGLVPGDVIARVGQTPVTSADEVQRKIREILRRQQGNDRKVALYVTRQNQSRYVVVTLN